MTNPLRLESRSEPHKMQSLGDKLGERERATQHRPDLGAMCREKLLRSGPT